MSAGDSPTQQQYKPTLRFWRDHDFEGGAYPKATNGVGGFERSILRHFGMPEDFQPTENEAYLLVTSYLED